MSPTLEAIRDGEDAIVRRYDYDTESVYVVDFGHVDGSVDLVDGTAIVVTDDDQHEFDVPADASRAVMNNGVVTVEMEH